jgi:hypothetical protein
VNTDRLNRPGPRRLAEDQGLPGDFLVGFTRSLMERREQLIRDGQPPELARQRAVTEAVQGFAAGADQRGWTVDDRRIASLAADALGLEVEYRDRHGYEAQLARLAAVGEILQGERARGEVPLPWWREADPPVQLGLVHDRQPLARAGPDGQAAVRTWEAGRER